jgi:Mn2+/Fe2+ NRAMP family transporter
MYRPVFGEVAQLMFLFGAFAVLYSTFFVANASLARVFSDVLRVLGFAASDDAAHVWRVRLLCALLPIACVTFYWLGVEPKAAVLISGIMQSIMLPMLAGAALYFRYRRCDARVQPGRAWDLFLWISAAVMLATGLWAAYQKIM